MAGGEVVDEPGHRGRHQGAPVAPVPDGRADLLSRDHLALGRLEDLGPIAPGPQAVQLGVPPGGEEAQEVDRVPGDVVVPEVGLGDREGDDPDPRRRS